MDNAEPPSIADGSSFIPTDARALRSIALQFFVNGALFASFILVGFTEITVLAADLADAVAAGELEHVRASLRIERPYPLPVDLAVRIDASQLSE